MYLIALFVMLGVMLFSSSGGMGTFIDPASAVFVIIATISLLGASGLWKDFRRGLRASFSKTSIYNEKELKKSVLAVKLTMWLLLSSGLFATIVGCVAMFVNLGIVVIASQVFASLSIALLTTVYSGIMILMLFPILFKLKTLIIDLEVENETSI